MLTAVSVLIIKRVLNVNERYLRPFSEVYDPYQQDCDNEIQNHFQEEVDPACTLKIF